MTSGIEPTDAGPDVPPEGGIVAEVAHMTQVERAEHEAAVAEAVAPDREIEVEVGETLLEMSDVTVRFGGLVALDHVSFDIRRGEILGLIGPNGAGKTTCFNAMTGVYRPTRARCCWRARRLGSQALPDHQARHGPHVPEHQAVRRDDRAGERGRRRGRAAQDERARCVDPAAASHREEQEVVERASALLEFVGIADRPRTRPATCPTASSAGWRSPGRWPPSRSCCAWTSRPRASTRPRRKNSWG